MEQKHTEFKALYLNFILYHGLLLFYFIIAKQWGLVWINAIDLLFYLLVVILVGEKSNPAIWLFAMDVSVVLTTLVTNRLISCKYGFTILSFMIIPIAMFYLYSISDLPKTVKKAYSLTNALMLITLISCVVNFREGISGELSPKGGHFVLICNLAACAGTATTTIIKIINTIQTQTKTVNAKNIELENALYHDKLTGVYNMDGFELTARNFLKENSQRDFYFLLSDVCNFRMVNELLGEEVGNELLIRQCRWLENHMTGCSVLGRYQADRFVMIVPLDAMKEELFDDLLDDLSGTFSTKVYHLHMHLGVYKITDKNESIRSMADKALLAIKRVKNNRDERVVYYTDNDLQTNKNTQELIASFDTALKNNEFLMYLQPQTNRFGSLQGAEALIRWQHPERGLISPGDFIAPFEEARIIHKLDAFIWECAAKKIHEWNKMGYNYYISVNVSTKDFYLMDVYEKFISLVDKYKISPESLRIEITETALALDESGLKNAVNKLVLAGFIIEIDDFGSGYSSLNLLKDINASVLKIDRQFLAKTDNEARARSILKSIISLAKDLDMYTVTEGVETVEQLTMLDQMGCKCFQGYYFSKPLPISAFEEMYDILN